MILKFRILINILVVGILTFLIIRVVEERILLNRFILDVEEVKNISKPYSSYDIITIRDYILSDINFASSEIASSRPKIGWTVRKILKNRQGLCGEGSRLLFHVLRADGIESRRIYLHGNNTLHVILEYQNKAGQWQLLETINGPGEGFRKKLDTRIMTVDSLFNFGPYRYHVTPNIFAESYNYQNFSYLPLNGIFNNSFFRTEVYVHKPMPGLINYLLETHEFFLVIFLASILLLTNTKQIIILIKGLLSKFK